MTTYPPPDPPYRGPASHHGDADNKPIRRIVLHSTVSPCVPGGAEDVARYFRSADAGGSAHYVVDPSTVVQVVYDSTTAARWDDANHRLMLNRVALLTAQLCLAYGVPVAYRSARGLKRGQHGVTTHHQVSVAFGQSTHWDPGKWPRRRFMRKVRRNVRQLRRDTPP